MVAAILSILALGQLTTPTTMPELNLKDLQGKTWRKEGLERDRIYLVEFWATWCTTCRAIHPEVQKFVKSQSDAKFTYLAVSVDDDLSALRKWARSEQPTYPVLMDPDFKAMERWKVKEVPSLFFVLNGKVLWRHTGQLKASDLDSAFAKLK